MNSIIKDKLKIINNIFNFSLNLKKEFFRKTIHMVSAFIPFFYFYHENLVMTGLLSITLFYFITEILRTKNIRIPIFTQIIEFASRKRDEGKLILGPITLSIGIFLCFTFFSYRSAVIAILAVSFGDGVASLFGKTFGGWKIPFTFGKTVSGTTGCFVILFIVYLNCGLSVKQALFVACAASIIEAFPTGDYDNLLIPVTIGFIVEFPHIIYKFFL